jgi:hypothetical protein
MPLGSNRILGAGFSFSSSTIRSAVFLPTPGSPEAGGVLGTIAGVDPRRRRRRCDAPWAIPATVSRWRKKLALSRVGEAVELKRVLADVEVRLDDRPSPPTPSAA